MTDGAGRHLGPAPQVTEAGTRDSSSGVRTEVWASLRGMEKAWDALVDRSPLPSPFLRSWWLEAVAGPRPSFVLVFHRDRLVGGVALEQDRVLGVERLRAVGFRLAADHLELVADPAHLDEVVAALRTWFTRPGARVIDLVGLAEGARITEALPSPVRSTVFDGAPWSALPATLSEYFDQRPPRLRSLVERPRRRLERAGAECRVVDVDDADPALERLRRLHEAHWGDGSEFLPHFERFARAARAGIARRELLIHEVWVGGEVVATHVSFEADGRLSHYQGGRDGDRRWRGVGTWLMALVVGDACERGCHEFDLLRGVEPYKQQWANDVRPLVHAAAAQGWRARLVASLLPAGRVARKTLRRMHLAKKAPS